MQNSRTTIRKEIREKRNSLNDLEHSTASEKVLSHIQQLSFVHSAQHIAIYLSVDSELNTDPIIEYFWQQGKNVYLPVLHPFSHGYLLFIQYDINTPMIQNRFRIPEPKLDQTKIIPMTQLDIIFTPLVAFDESGQRLGMGGGYYDRCLENNFKVGAGTIPVGLAHNCQQIKKIPQESWDIPLPMIITPNKVWKWDHSPLRN